MNIIIKQQRNSGATIPSLSVMGSGDVSVLESIWEQYKQHLGSLLLQEQPVKLVAAIKSDIPTVNNATLTQGTQLSVIDHLDNTESIVKLTLEQIARSPEIGSLSCPPPLVPTYDRTVSDIELKPRKIPRIMHMTMKSRCLPPDLAIVTNAWKEALPYHSFYFHGDDAVERVFQLNWKEFPQLKSMMRCIKLKGAMKIDVWRMLVVYLFGGIYADIDVPPGPNFTEISPIKADDEAFSSVMLGQDRHNGSLLWSLNILLATTHPEIGSLSCPPPLVPTYDRTVSDIELKPRKIPRIMHMTMKSRCLPPDLAIVTNAWKEALPYHSFYFHDDDAVERVFQLNWKEFPQLKSMMRCIKLKGAMKIDVWRMLVVYLFGGIYADIDVPPGPNFTEISPIKADDEAFFFSDAWTRPSQWFFAMEPKHPVGYYTVHEILKRLQDLKTLEKPNVVFVTGPDALKHGYGNALGWPSNLFEEGTHKSKKFNKTATKKRHPDSSTINPNILDMGKIVPWNETENVTRRERIERQSGIVHWTKQ
ncbi:hypothetical protein HJC23_006938, partial [Cyclotella cryptica]